MRKIKTVIIGCGNITGLNEKDLPRIKPATHIGAIKKGSRFNLCGVYDLDKSKSEEFKKTSLMLSNPSNREIISFIDLMPLSTITFIN